MKLPVFCIMCFVLLLPSYGLAECSTYAYLKSSRALHPVAGMKYDNRFDVRHEGGPWSNSSKMVAIWEKPPEKGRGKYLGETNAGEHALILDKSEYAYLVEVHKTPDHLVRNAKAMTVKGWISKRYFHRPETLDSYTLETCVLPPEKKKVTGE